MMVQIIGSVWSGTWCLMKAIMPMVNSPNILNPLQKTTTDSGSVTRNYTTPLQILSAKKTEMYQAYKNAASCPLPPGTVFYEELLTFEGTPANSPGARRKRIACRNEWVRGALSATKACDFIFVDPDNGLEAGIKRHMKRGPKYVFFDELEPYCKRGQSLIIYHHTSRRGTERIKSGSG